MLTAFKGPPRIVRLFGMGNSAPYVVFFDIKTLPRHCTRVRQPRVRSSHSCGKKTRGVTISHRVRYSQSGIGEQLHRFIPEASSYIISHVATQFHSSNSRDIVRAWITWAWNWKGRIEMLRLTVLFLLRPHRICRPSALLDLHLTPLPPTASKGTGETKIVRVSMVFLESQADSKPPNNSSQMPLKQLPARSRVRILNGLSQAPLFT